MSAGAKALVLSKLQQVFGQYVDGITPENLRVQLVAGTLTQHNLRLKEEALSELNLPVTVRAGRLGKFVVRVPWRHLASQPVVVEIDTVELLAATNHSLAERPDPGLAERIQAAIRQKLDRVQNAEITRQGRAEMDGSGDEKYLDRLGRRVLENLRVRVSGVHLRFEDPHSSPCVAVGLTLKELSVVSTDASWGAEGSWVELEDAEERRKLIRMSELEVYWHNPPPDQQLLPMVDKGASVERAFQSLQAARKQQIVAGGKALQAAGATVTDPILDAKQERRERRSASLGAWGEFPGKAEIEREIAELDVEIKMRFANAYRSLYWSQQCLVSRTSFEVKLTLGDPPASKAYQVEGVMREFNIRVTHRQYAELMAFMREFDDLDQRSDLHRTYPRILGGTPCFGGRLQSRWRQVVALVRDQRCYVDLYRRKSQGAALSEQEGHALQIMEWRLSVPVIMAFRSISDAEVAARLTKSEAQVAGASDAAKLKKEKSDKKAPGNTQRLFGVFKSKGDRSGGGGGGASTSEDVDAIVLTDEERAELFHAMESPFGPEESSLPDGFCSTSVRFVLEKSCITLASEDFDLVQVTWDGVYNMRKIAAGDRDPTTEVELGIDMIRVQDCTGGSQRYSSLVGDLPVPGAGLARTESTAVDPLDVPRVAVLNADGSTPRGTPRGGGGCVSLRQMALQMQSGELTADQLVYVPPGDGKHRVDDLVDFEDVAQMDDAEIEELAFHLKTQLCHTGQATNQAVIIGVTLTPADTPNSINLRVPRALQVVYNPAIVYELVQIFQSGPELVERTEMKTKIDESKTKSKLKNAAQADWHLHADIMTPVFILPADCGADDGPCAALDFGRLEVDVNHGGQYSAPDFTDLNDISKRSDGSIQLPSVSDTFDSAIKVKMSGMQLLLSDRPVDWARELALQSSDLGLVPKCTMSVEISGAQGAWCTRVNAGAVCFEATARQWYTFQEVHSGIMSTREVSGGKVKISRAQKMLLISRKAKPRATRQVTSTLMFVCPRGRCVLLGEDRTRILSAAMDELVVAANIGSSQKAFCAIRSVSIVFRPDQPEERLIARCIVDEDSTTEDLVVIQYTRSTQKDREADHVVIFKVAEIVAEWHLDIMLQVKNTIHFDSKYEPEPEPELEPEPDDVSPTTGTAEARERRQKRLRSEPASADTTSLGMFRLMQDCGVRQGVEMESPSKAPLKRGTIVELLEMSRTRSHTQRARCAEGWLSVRSSDGTMLMCPTATRSPRASSSSAAAPQSLAEEPKVDESIPVPDDEDEDDDALLIRAHGVFRGFTAVLFKDGQQQYSLQMQEGSLDHLYLCEGVHRTVSTVTKLSILDVGHPETRYPTILGPPGDVDASLITVEMESGGDWHRGKRPAGALSPSRSRETSDDQREQRKATIKLSPMRLVYIKETVDDIRAYIQSALAVVMKLSEKQQKLELQIHDPRIVCPLSYTSRSYGLLSAEYIDLVRIGNYVQLTTESGHSTAFHAMYVSDFGGCVAPVVDVEVTFLFLNAQSHPTPRHGVTYEMKAQLNVTAEHWDFGEGKWRAFAELAGEERSIDVALEKGYDGASRIDFEQYQKCVPVVNVTDSLLTCLSQSWKARQGHSRSVIDNLCGIPLIVTQPGGVPQTVPVGGTIGLATRDIANAAHRFVIPTVKVAIENYETECEVPVFRNLEFPFATSGLIDGRRKEVTVVFIVQVEAARIKIQCVSTLVVTNKTKLELEIMAIEQQVAQSGGSVPGNFALFDVPVTVASASEIRLRPAALSDVATFKGAPLLVTPKLTADQPSSFELPGGERYFFRVSVSPSKLRRFVTIQPAFVVKNHLPELVRVGLRSSGSQSSYERCEIPGGLTAQYFSDSLGGSRSVEMDLHIATGRWERVTVKLQMPDDKADKTIDLRIPHQDGKLFLTVRATFITRFEVELSSRTWLCNKSGLQLRLECRGRWESWPPAETTGVGETGGVVSLDVGEAEEIGVAAGWSTFGQVKVNKLGERDVVLLSRRERIGYNLHYIVDSGPAAFPMTRMVIIRPSFGVVNEFKENIFVRCGDSQSYGEVKEIAPGVLIPLHFQPRAQDTQLKNGCIRNCQFGFPIAGTDEIAWSDDLLLDQPEQQKLSALIENRLLSIEIMIGRPEVAKLIVASPGDLELVYAAEGQLERASTRPESPTHDSDSESTFFVTGTFSKVEIQLSQMILFRQRHETGPMRQKRLLHGDILAFFIENCRVEGRTTSPGLLKCSRLRVSNIRIQDSKHRSAAKTLKTVLEISHPSSNALDLRVQREKGSAVPQVELTAAVGNLRLDMDDVFLTRCMLLQKNILEHMVGRSEKATALSVIGGMKCELNRRVLPPDITLFLKYLDVSGISPSGKTSGRHKISVTASFRRLQTWLPNMFPVPQGVSIENQELRVPSVHLKSVLGDSDSVKNRVKASVVPHLKRQWTNESAARKFEIYASNFETILDEATGGTGVSTVLAQKKAELGFRQVEFAENSAIVKTHVKQLRVARSQVDFDMNLWHMLYDWDYNHTGLDPMRRRIVVVALLNRSSQPVKITNIRLVEGDKAYRSNVELLPLHAGGNDWQPSHTSVVVATGNSPFGARFGLSSGEVSVQVETSALNITATHSGIQVKPLKRQLTHNVVSMDIHQWWSRWILIVSDKTVTLASRLVTVLFQQPGALGLQTDDRNGGVTISGLSRGTQSEEHPILEIGMQISRVSGEDCAGLGYSQIISMIREHPSRPLAITFLPVNGESKPAAPLQPQPQPQPQPEPEPELQPQRLSEMKLSALKVRARAAGIDDDQLDEADDATDVRGAVIALILAKEGVEFIES